MHEADSVQPDAEPDHVELRFRKALDARAVIDVTQNVQFGKSGCDPVAQLAEQRDLRAREIVVACLVAACQMREDRPDIHFGGLAQRVD